MKTMTWFFSGFAAIGLTAGAALAQDAKPVLPPPPPVPAIAAAPAPATAAPAVPAPAPVPPPKAPAPAVAPVVPTVPEVMASCCDACCKFCGCDDCCHGGGVIADFSMMFLKPHWANNPALLAGTIFTGIGTTTVQFEDFDFNMQFVPRVALGYMGACDVGVRTTWWGFAESASRASSVVAISALPLITALTNETLNDGGTVIGTLEARGHLNMNVWDNEVIYALQTGRWDFLLGAGLRYAHIAQRYDAYVRDGTGAVVDTLLSGHSFNGAGPLLTLEIKRGLGDGSIYTLANVRGALLFGTRKNSAGAVGSTVQIGFGSDEGDRIANSNDVFVPVGELELGVGFQRPMGRVRLISEASLIAQSWWNAGNSSRSEFIFTTANEALGLFGFGFKIGVTY
jgi:hypothetical protein